MRRAPTKTCSESVTGRCRIGVESNTGKVLLLVHSWAFLWFVYSRHRSCLVLENALIFTATHQQHGVVPNRWLSVPLLSDLPISLCGLSVSVDRLFAQEFAFVCPCCAEPLSKAAPLHPSVGGRAVLTTEAPRSAPFRLPTLASRAPGTHRRSA